MSIKKIPALSINGSGGQNQRPIFNGYIYSVNYDVKVGSEGYSNLIVNIASEDGTYTITPNDLALNRVYSITIGKYVALQMYIKSYKTMVSPRGRLLEVEFIDGSYILDIFQVGLHKKQGCNPLYKENCPIKFGDNLEDNMIIVGREIHPCDKDFDGKIDEIKNVKDPCHPCNKDLSEEAALRVRVVDCKDQVKYSILEVKYNFGDLIKALETKGFKIKNAKDPNPKCLAEYTGSLREVLSNWCADFGWIFFWENGEINFKDLRTVINVNANINEFCPNIESREEQYTLEGTIQNNVITNYSREGVNREDFTCQDAVYIAVPPYTKASSPGSKLRISEHINEKAAALSYYDLKLRSLWYWFEKYKLGDPAKLVPGYNIKELGLKILTSPVFLEGSAPANTGGLQTSSLEPATSLDSPPFTQSAIFHDESIDLDFMTADLSDFPDLLAARDLIEQEDNSNFSKCFRLIPSEQQWKIARDIKDKYFFVAFWDETSENEYAALERSYATDFMGKYNIYLPNLLNREQKEFFEDYKFIVEDNPCNTRRKIKQDQKISFKCQGDDNAQVEYFNSNSLTEDGDLESISKLPFSKFLSIFQESGEAETSAQAIQDFKIVVVNKGNQQWFPTPAQIDPDDSDSTPPRYNINNTKLINQAFSYYPIKFDMKHDDRGEDLVRVLVESANYKPRDMDSNRIFIFMGTRAKNDQFGLSTSLSSNPTVSIGTPYNGMPLNPNDSTDPTRKHEVIYQYPELKCLTLGNLNTSSNKVTFKTPAGNFSFFEPTYSNYGAVIEKTRAVTQRIQKMETIMYSGKKANAQTLQSNFSYYNITDEDIRLLAKQPSNGACIFSKEKIKAVHDNFVKNLSYSQTVPLVKKVFTIAGLDVAKIPSINDGLLGIQVSVDDSGVKSTYTFGTTKMTPPKKAEIYSSSLETILNNNLKGYNGAVLLENKTKQ